MMNRNEVGERREDQAVSWFVQLQDCDDEEVWIAHREWLEADVANVSAYDAVENAWVDAESLAGVTFSPAANDIEPTAVVDETVVELSAHRTSARRRLVMWWLPTAAAASLVAITAGSQIRDLFATDGTTYSTGSASGREITLADGSRLALDRNTVATVRVTDETRRVTLASGQAAFDVHHDAARPFTITAAGREVQVLGTEFDVLSRNGAFGVTVRRGLVSVSKNGATGKIVRLPAGNALLRLPGSDSDLIERVDPANASAWREGRLVYLDSDLNAVARDYERFVGQRVTVAPDVGALHISGVVRARDEDDLIHQLEALLPIRILKSPDGREIRKR